MIFENFHPGGKETQREVQKENETIKYELGFKGNNFTNSVPEGKSPVNTVTIKVLPRKCNNWTYAYYRFSSKRAPLNIFSYLILGDRNWSLMGQIESEMGNL